MPIGVQKERYIGYYPKYIDIKLYIFNEAFVWFNSQTLVQYETVPS
jgi:hypothetical protein